jgi:hypothetical protein
MRVRHDLVIGKGATMDSEAMNRQAGRVTRRKHDVAMDIPADVRTKA